MRSILTYSDLAHHVSRTGVNRWWEWWALSGLFSLLSSSLFNFSFIRLKFISLLSHLGVVFKTPCSFTSALINSLSSCKISNLVGGQSFNWTTKKYIFFFSSVANFLVASVKADRKAPRWPFPGMPWASLFKQHESPVGSGRYSEPPVLVSSASRCSVHSTVQTGHHPSSEDATVLFENKQPFRARVFYINRRAKVLKTKLDRRSYV